MRDRYLAFIDRHDIAWELGMAALAVAFLVVGFAADDPTASPVLGTIETALTPVFVAEFVRRMSRAGRWRTECQGWAVNFNSTDLRGQSSVVASSARL